MLELRTLARSRGFRPGRSKADTVEILLAVTNPPPPNEPPISSRTRILVGRAHPHPSPQPRASEPAPHVRPAAVRRGRPPKSVPKTKTKAKRATVWERLKAAHARGEIDIPTHEGIPVYMGPSEGEYEKAIKGAWSQAVQAKLMGALSARYPWLCSLTTDSDADPHGLELVWIQDYVVTDSVFRGFLRVAKLPEGAVEFSKAFSLAVGDLPRFRATIERCLANPATRMIAFIIHLNCGSEGHANAIVYDRDRNEVERWEPHGVESLESCDPQRTLDANLAWLFANLFGWKFVRPQESCPVLRGLAQPGVVQGSFHGDAFCFTWSLLYIETRIANPRASSADVSRRLAETAHRSPEFAEMLVRRYAGLVSAAWRDYGQFHTMEREQMVALRAISAMAISALVGKPVPDPPIKI